MAQDRQALLDFLKESLGETFSEEEARQLLAYLSVPHEKRIPLWNANSVSPTRDATPEEIDAIREIAD